MSAPASTSSPPVSSSGSLSTTGTPPPSSGTPASSAASAGSTSSVAPTNGTTPAGNATSPSGLPSPVLQSQTPIFACVPASYNISGGTPPYQFVYVINSGIPNAPILKTLPDEGGAGTFSWGVDIEPGTSVTFVAKDSQNQTGYSAPIVVEAPADGNLKCLKVTHHHSKTGAIVGGVIGGLAAIAIGYLLFSWYHRRQRDRLRDELVRAGEIEVETVETGYGKTEQVVRRPTLQSRRTAGTTASADAEDEVAASGGANLARAGTFNLRGIPTRERDVDEEALTNPPPRYRRPEGSSAAPSVDTDTELRGP